MRFLPIIRWMTVLALMLSAGASSWVQADSGKNAQDKPAAEINGSDAGLPTLDSLYPRVSMQHPKESIPNQLTIVPVVKPGEYFVPANIEDMPPSKYRDEVRLGRHIFIDTQHWAKRFVGNGLNCSSCHLQEGRKPYAAPMWAAWGMYPMYMDKSRRVVSFQERMQSCFRTGLNGTAPTLDSLEIEALTAYAQWMATGVPLNTIMPGRGFARIDKSIDPSPFNGAVLYKQYCAECHGADMHGKKFANGDGYMFPPLSGPDSFNKGSGMYKVKTCAAFVKANMPLGRPYTLTDDQALEVCIHIWKDDHPYDPGKSIFMNTFMPVTEG